MLLQLLKIGPFLSLGFLDLSVNNAVTIFRFPKPRRFSPFDRTSDPLLVKSRHSPSIQLALSDAYKAYQHPFPTQKFTLKTATVIFVKTLENIAQSKRFNSENRSYRLVNVCVRVGPLHCTFSCSIVAVVFTCCRSGSIT